VKGNPSVEDAVRDAQKLGEPPKIEPDVQTLPNGVTEVSGPILRLNSLEVNTEKLIGTGSNGTMVFEGKFDGREVAVKRMLIQFFDIASQETKLLRESDDHPNGTGNILLCWMLLTLFSNSILCSTAKRGLSLHRFRTMSRISCGCH
jgi:serine/threonine-protein kinase/endoribonuclease IRE1